MRFAMLLCLLLSATLFGGCSRTKDQAPAPDGQSAAKALAPTGQSTTDSLTRTQAAAKPQGPTREALREVMTARAKEAAQKKAQKVLERARAATRVTKAALSKIIEGRAIGSGSEGRFRTEISSPSGGRFWYSRALEGKTPFEAIITPKGAWSVSEDGTRTPLTGRTALMIKSHDFQRIALDPESFVQEIGWVKETKFRSVKSQELLGFTPDRTKVYFYFDDKSGLPLGFKIADPMQAGNSVTIIFREWKEVGGVRMPSDILALDSERNFHFSFQGLTFQDEEK